MCIYHLVGRITQGGAENRTFFARMNNVSEHFGFGYDSVLRAFKMLRKTGWLIREANGHWRQVDHKDWLKTHPDACAVRDELPWQDTLAADPLIKRLYAASQGRLRLFERQVEKLHSLDRDDELVGRYVKELALQAEKKKRNEWAGTSNESCLWRVFKWMREYKATSEEVLTGKSW